MFGGAQAAAARPDERIDFLLAEKAAAFFAQQTKDTPFFLYLANNLTLTSLPFSMNVTEE